DEDARGGGACAGGRCVALSGSVLLRVLLLLELLALALELIALLLAALLLPLCVLRLPVALRLERLPALGLPVAQPLTPVLLILIQPLALALLPATQVPCLLGP